MKTGDVLKKKCKQGSYEKISSIKNKTLIDFITKYALLCNPESVFVRTDSKEDSEYIRKKAIELGEEINLKIKGHTAHFDGLNDQGRDKGSTKFLITKDMHLEGLNAIDRNKGLCEMQGLLKDIMKGREMFILFLCLGPVNSEFSIYAVQITDSAYVAHSEDMLYRPAYNVFKESTELEFFKYVHSAGEVDENKASKDVDKRRVYVDLLENTVYSVNTQYAGNTVGLKKLSLRLAIKRADHEGWLAEHMFVMAVHAKDGSKDYFTGAFPSSCGKTSTCMVEGEKILGDDIAYLRKKNGQIYAVNVERGIFGIIKDVNPMDDPLISGALHNEGEVIFSNILVKDGVPYWQGDGKVTPGEGRNFSGSWYSGKIDEFGNEIQFAHPNARYTIKLNTLKNCDSELENPKGVLVKGIIYGGRDSDTWVPVFESFNWEHGVITIAASLESETTAATLGKVGERKFNVMANLDFLSIAIEKYIENHLNFPKDIKNVPLIFGVNYFLRDKQGNYLTGMQDKRVWLKWMQLRTNKEADAIKTPLGYLPYHKDLKDLFSKILAKNFSEDDYINCFSIRSLQNLEKIERISNIYKGFKNIPQKVFDVLLAQRKRLETARKEYGDLIPPQKFI